MTTHYQKTGWYVHSGLGLGCAITAGLCFASIILQDAFPNGVKDWSHVKPDHFRAPALVGITAILWLYAFNVVEWKRAWGIPYWPKHVLSAVAIGAAAIFCSSLLIYQSMGRVGENLDVKIMTAEVSEQDRIQAALSLQHARDRLAEVDPIRRSECKGAPEPLPVNGWPNCRKYRGSAEAYEASIARLEKKLAEVAPVPVDPAGARVGYIASAFGFDGGKSKEAAQMLSPVGQAIGFEIVMILMVHASIKKRKPAPVIEDAKAVEVEAPETKALTFERPTGDYTDDELADLKELFGKLSEILSKNEDLNSQQTARKLGMSPGHYSRLRRRLEGSGYLASEKVGKEVRTRLVARDGVRVAA